MFLSKENAICTSENDNEIEIFKNDERKSANKNSTSFVFKTKKVILKKLNSLYLYCS
jgi:hypothetical protein